jgi:hypothetical protein
VNPTIFVNVAAYREFDLINTLRDCFAQAEDAARLRVCVCWQRDAGDSLAELESDPRVDLIDVPYRESQGVCWARNLIQRRYGGEAYTLQIDGHHRFAPRWDRLLIDMVERLRQQGVPKPIITGYMPGFDPWNDPAGRVRTAWGTGIDRFETGGVVFMRPFVPAPAPTAPMPCRFWSAHCSFTLGQFNEEVLIDPRGYFHSEEIVMGVRAWTHGYDLFNPHQLVIWHEYTRKGRRCHWDDHPDWGARDAKAIAQYRRQFGVDGTARERFDPYDFGPVRSFREYERFAGLEFATRGVQPHTIANGCPPDPLADASDDEWRRHLHTSFCTDVWIERARLDVPDCDMWGVFANAEDGTELFREDYLRPRVDEYLSSQQGDHVHFFIAFFGQRAPHRWTVWPHSRKRGWLDRIDGLWPRPMPTPASAAA